MKTIAKTLTPFLFTLTLLTAGACGGGGGTVGKLNKLADEMCECKDAKCATEVDKKVSELKKTAKKPKDSDKEKAQKALAKIRECWMKAQLGGKG